MGDTRDTHSESSLISALEEPLSIGATGINRKPQANVASKLQQGCRTQPSEAQILRDHWQRRNERGNSGTTREG